MLGVHANVVTRILRDLAAKQLVEHHELQGKNKTYRLTKRGELGRQILDNLIEPKTLPVTWPPKTGPAFMLVLGSTEGWMRRPRQVSISAIDVDFVTSQIGSDIHTKS